MYKETRKTREDWGETEAGPPPPFPSRARLTGIFTVIRPTLSESLARARSAKIVRSRDPLTRIESRDRIAVSVKRPVEVWPQLLD